MALIDVNEIERKAREEISKEVTDTAVTKLKELFTKREKAALVLRNIEKEIAAYKADIADNAVYESAGIDVIGK